MPRQNISCWNPESFGHRAAFLRIRASLTRALRSWFEAQGFCEVETPILQISPGLEPHLHAFRTELSGPRPGERATRYLHTSPEFAMKKLLAAGLPEIWQLARVMRNGEQSDLHHPEFTMLEWYRAGGDYRHLMLDCEDMIGVLRQAMGVRRVVFRDMACDLDKPWRRISVADAFAEHAGIDLLAILDMTSPKHPDRGKLAAESLRIGVHVADEDGWEDIFFRILGMRVEPYLGNGAPVFLTDYPLPLAALARAKPEDPRLAERFELYISGVEIANGFGELTDPDEQRARFEADMALKQKLYGERYPIDEDFIEALAAMPPAAGIALGWDRLVMLLSGAARIEDVLWLPVAPA